MLPKIESITFTTTLPVTKQEIVYRPYTIKEEKILLIAVKSSDPNDMVRAVKQVVTNCVLSPGFDVETLHTFDLEYFLVKLRIAAVSDVLELSFKDAEDDRVYPIAINLNKVLDEIAKDVVIPDSTIMLSDTIGVEMKHITIDMLLNDELADINDPLKIYQALPKLMKHVFDKDTIYKFEDADEEDVEAFFDSFDKAATQKLGKYFESIPRLHYKVSYTNSLGSVREYELDGLADFFQ